MKIAKSTFFNSLIWVLFCIWIFSLNCLERYKDKFIRFPDVTIEGRFQSIHVTAKIDNHQLSLFSNLASASSYPWCSLQIAFTWRDQHSWNNKFDNLCKQSENINKWFTVRLDFVDADSTEFDYKTVYSIF